MQTNNKETEILKAAEELFAEKGFIGATTTLIASKAGVTHAMLHYYFRTKEHIFIKVM
ncbi:MAG: helix-turn-helix transcriptional regulator, partial [Bacteroidales bacterium]|nr:helix-turn-helix transcriptional regulator [Candidatus Cacconaster equifaecalis]